MNFDESVENALTVLKKLPFITGRTAQKIIFFLLKNRKTYTQELIRALEKLTFIGECSICNMPSGSEICNICSSFKRNDREMIVVEDFADLFTIEQMGEYNGKYFLLNRRLDIKNGIGPENLGIERLIEVVRKRQVEEIIFAFDQSPEMEATKSIIVEKLSPLNVNMFSIAIGIPFGSEVEFSDKRTIKYALLNKVKIE
ncbi:MAG: toprim domain-containing protein [Deltaproteobacteria bacterium]|nr:toprim domain-containing protein [Deltaproteobacteria bacterium]